MKGELFPLYKVLNEMSVSRSTTDVDLVFMIGTIVFKGAECTSGNVKRLRIRFESFACCSET